MKGAALTLAPLPTLADVVGVAPLPTLADVVDETLGDGLRLGAARCLWCGEVAVAVVADRWTRRVVLRCPACGSELEGRDS
ncbi:MAG TPA: hypothetical protein PLK79_07565 [Thermoleophilia bacterium]|nr:hypothetical protein [Thermoleophilia bacterium]